MFIGAVVTDGRLSELNEMEVYRRYSLRRNSLRVRSLLLQCFLLLNRTASATHKAGEAMKRDVQWA
jgi:hypothetical protein